MLLGYALGLAAYPFMGERRKVIRRNLRACFPERAAAWRGLVALGHQAMLGRFLLDHALLLAAGERRFRRLVRVEGMENLEALKGRPAILLVPHTVGIDHGGVRLAMDRGFTTMYAPQSSKAADRLILRCRTRLAKRMCLLSNRAATVGQTVSALKAGDLLYYLSDMDQARRSKSVYIPLLGHDKAATLTTLPRLARLTGAAVLPCITAARPLGGYVLWFGKPFEDFPSGDDEADMLRHNDLVGSLIRAHPTQYYWPHKRFKNRPEGEPDVYA